MAFLDQQEQYNCAITFSDTKFYNLDQAFCIENVTKINCYDCHNTNIPGFQIDQCHLLGIYCYQNDIVLLFKDHIIVHFNKNTIRLDYTLDKRFFPKILDHKIAPICDGLVVLDNEINKVIVIKQDSIKYYDLPENNCLISIMKITNHDIVINYINKDDNLMSYYKVISGQNDTYRYEIKKNNFCSYKYLGSSIHYVIYCGEVYYVNILESKFDKFTGIEFDKNNNLLFTDGENYYTALGFRIPNNLGVSIYSKQVKSARNV